MAGKKCGPKKTGSTVKRVPKQRGPRVVGNGPPPAPKNLQRLRRAAKKTPKAGK